MLSSHALRQPGISSSAADALRHLTSLAVVGSWRRTLVPIGNSPAADLAQLATGPP